MSLWKIAWRSIQQRSLASTLTAISMGLGVMLVVAVLVLSSVVQKSFTSANSLGYNMIAGAKGGRLDLLLNTVFYLNRPIANIPWTFYQEFLPAAQRTDHKDGQYAPMSIWRFPFAWETFSAIRPNSAWSERTPRFSPSCFTRNSATAESSRTTTSRPRWSASEVADELHLKVGGDVVPIHGGVGGEKHMPFRITGVLARTGTPNDRAAFVNLEGFFLIPDHARGHVEEQACARRKRRAGKNADDAAARQGSRRDRDLAARLARQWHAARAGDDRLADGNQPGRHRPGDPARSGNSGADRRVRPPDRQHSSWV